jgi:nucleoid DNA-binding protein
MISTNEDEKTLAELSLITGISIDEIEEIFSAFLIQFTFKYANNKRIFIPYIGSFLVRYRNDLQTEEGMEAQLDAFFSPHDELKRIVGQMKDIESGGETTNLDTYNNLKKIIKNDFKTKLTEE